jgi:hypothetical protein
LEAKLREAPQAPFHGFIPPKHFGAGGKRERLGHIRLSNTLGLSARGGRTLAARGDSATMDRADRNCPNDPQCTSSFTAPIRRGARQQKKNIRSILTWE